MDNSELNQLKKGAEKGHLDSILELADYYDDLDELDQAVNYYQKAVDLGDPYAKTQLGGIYEKTDPESCSHKILDLYASAAKQGYGPAFYLMGSLYEEGELVKANVTTSVSFYKDGADHDDIDCIRWYGDYLISKKQYRKALVYFKKGAVLEDQQCATGAMLCLSRLNLSKQDIEEITALCKKPYANARKLFNATIFTLIVVFLSVICILYLILI